MVCVLVGQTSAGHAVDHGDVDPRLAALGVVFVVLRQPSVPVEPTERTLHHPTPRLHLEPHHARTPGHDVQYPLPRAFYPTQPRPVHAVGPHPHQSRQPVTDPREHLDGPVPVGRARRQHGKTPDQPTRVHQQVPLASRPLLSPRRTPSGRPLRLSGRSDCR